MALDNNDIYILIKQTGTFIYQQYHYYVGVLIRMVIDYNKWTIKSLLAYVTVSMLLVELTVHLLTNQKFGYTTILYITIIIGIIGHSGLRYFLDNVLIEVLTLLKEKLIQYINKL